MTDQNSLQGFEHQDITGSNHPGFTRRRADLQPGDLDHLETAASHDAPLVSVFTLGRFSLLLNGKPAEFGRKAPQRPLELLKAIIALGGREVSSTSLMSALWPDVDGDVAQRSFDTTLHLSLIHI